MSKRKIQAGSTSVSLPIFVQDTTSATSGGLAGLTYSTPGLTCKYRRQGQSASTTVVLVTKALGTWINSGFVATDSLPGSYEIDLPNATFTAGARWVTIELYGAVNMVPIRIEVELDAVDYQNANNLGLGYLSGDVYGRIGANGAGLTALGDARLNNLDALVSGDGGRAAVAILANPTYKLLTSATGTVNAQVVGIDNGVIGANAFAVNALKAVIFADDAIQKIQAGLATGADADTIEAYVDTLEESAATIKGYTDSLEGTLATIEQQLLYVYNRLQPLGPVPITPVPAPPVSDIPLAALTFNCAKHGLPPRRGVKVKGRYQQSAPMKLGGRWEIMDDNQGEFEFSTNSNGDGYIHLPPSSYLVNQQYLGGYYITVDEVGIKERLVTLDDNGTAI